MYNSRKQSSDDYIKERENNMPKLDLSSFAPLLEQGKNFEITEEQYDKITSLCSDKFL